MKVKFIVVSAILCFSQMLLADNANQLLEDLRKDLAAMSANFEQYEIDANGQVSEVSTGMMWLNAPDQFKWEYINPAPQLIVANGDKVWIYDEDLDQVTIKQQDSKQNPIYVLLNKEETQKNYIVEDWQDQSNSNNDIDWISFTPKIISDDIKQVWVGVLNNQIKVLKLKNQFDNIVVFQFNDEVRNPPLSSDFFTFTPPEGVDIISDGLEL